MNKNSFRNLVQEKTGLTDKEYDQLFDALEEKYNVTEESIAAQIPDKIGAFNAENILDIAAPNTSNEMVTPTKYDESIADKLGVDAETIAKVTNWGGQVSENIDNVPFVGGQVKDMLEDNGLGDFIGSQRQIGKAIDEKLVTVTENTAEGATADAQKEDSSFWERLQDRLGGNEVSENTVTLDKSSSYDYYNEEAGVALRGVGNSMRVYLIEEDGSMKSLGKVDCAKEDRAEFVSEFEEKVDKVADAGSGISGLFNIKGSVAMGVAEDVSKDIEDEKEIGTGNKFTDIIRDKTEEKYEKLQDKVEDMQEKIDNMDDGWFKNAMTKILEKSQEELNKYEEQLEKFDQMEIDNAKEIKAKVEAAKTQLQEQMDKIDNMNFFSDELKDKLKSGLEAQMDELDDRLSAVNQHLAEAKLEAGASGLEAAESNLQTVAEGKVENDSWFDKFKDSVQDAANDAKEWVSDALADAKSSAQTFVANVDNVIGGVKDDIAEWANSVAQNEHVQNFSETFSNFYDNIQDDLGGIKDAAVSFGKEFAEDASNVWEDVKDVAKDIHDDAADAWDKAVDNVKDWASDIGDKLGFGKDDDDVTLDIDD